MISFADFNVSTWYIFANQVLLDPTFYGVFVTVCCPLQLMFIYSERYISVCFTCPSIVIKCVKGKS